MIVREFRSSCLSLLHQMFAFIFLCLSNAGNRTTLTPFPVTFVDETEGLSNNYESESESDTPFPPSEGGPSVSAGSTSSSHVSRSAASPSLSSIRLIVDSDTGQTPRSPENATSLGTTNPSTLDTTGQHSMSSKSPFSHDDFTQLPSPGPSTGKPIAEDDLVGITYDAFQNTIAPPPSPSIYLDTPVWPLTDPSEAVLLRHFVQNLATWVCHPATSNFFSRVLLMAPSWTSVIQCSISKSKFHVGRAYAQFY